MSIAPADDVSKVLGTLAGASGRLCDRFDERQLRRFVEELLTWNREIPLVSRRDTPAAVARLIERSVHLWDFVRDAVARDAEAPRWRIVDIGTGAGFPGLVWKMLARELDVVLVERRERKVAFLERVIARLSLEGVSAVAADLSEFARYQRHEHTFDLAVMMAVTNPEEIAEPVERLLRAPGYFCVVRGRDQETAKEPLGGRFRELARSESYEGRFLLFTNSAPISGPA